MNQEVEPTLFDPAQVSSEETSDANMLVRDPVVSVSMITYNHASWIGQAIESVVEQQTDFPFELIVAEDCSTDETRRIILDYQRRYPKIIRLITSARNVGVKRNNWRAHRACRGRYVAICEGDDYWHHPLKLQKQVDFLDRHPDYGLVHSDCDVLVEHLNERIPSHDKTTNRIPYVKSDLWSSLLLGSYRVRTASACMRKDLVDRVLASDAILFSSDRFPMGDFPMWLEMSRLCKFKYLEESLATYRVLLESATNSEDIRKVIQFEQKCFELYDYLMKKSPCPDKVRKTVVEKCGSRFVDLAFKAGDVQLADQAVDLLDREGVHVGFRTAAKRWTLRARALNKLAVALQYRTRPLRCGKEHVSRY